MATIRMSNGHRHFLLTLARETISCAAEEKADKGAYERADKTVRAIVEKRYPPKDMKLLRRYDVAAPDDCVRIQLAAGGVVQFRFRDEKAAPLAPAGACSRRMYMADAGETEIITASLDAMDALKKARDKKLADYEALVWASATLDQIEAVWPAAAALRARVGRTLPITLSDDVIARIRADSALTMRAASTLS